MATEAAIVEVAEAVDVGNFYQKIPLSTSPQALGLAGMYDERVMGPLASHRFLFRASLAAGNIFAWVFLFHFLYIIGHSAVGALGLTALGYAFVHTLTFLLTPLASRRLIRGVRHALIYATLSYACAILFLLASFLNVFEKGPVNFGWGIAGFIFFLGLYRALYFVPYSVERTFESQSGSHLVFELFLALVPAVVGTITVAYAFGPFYVLFGTGLLACVALVPLAFVREVYEPFSWNYGDTVRELFNSRHRAMLAHSFVNGVQGAGLLFIWPLAAFLLLGARYQLLGVVMSITLLWVFVMRGFVVPYIAAKGVSRDIATVVMFSSWIVRFAAFSPATIVIADVLYHAGLPVRRLGIDIVTLEHVADGGHYIDELTALKEMSLALGRVMVGVFVASLAVSGSLQLMFLGGLVVALVASTVALIWQPERSVA